MKRMVGCEAASQIAAASLGSLLPIAPWLRYGSTSCAEMIRGPRQSAASLRAQWCALDLASMATSTTNWGAIHGSDNEPLAYQGATRLRSALLLRLFGAIAAQAPRDPRDRARRARAAQRPRAQRRRCRPSGTAR